MNSYTKHQISRFYEKYITRQFDQDDVSLLIVLVRDYTQPGSIFRELGDFLAHPSAKDRGLVIDNFKSIVDYFENNNNIKIYQDIDNKEIWKPIGLGLNEDVHNSLSELFSLVGIKYLAKNHNSNPFRDFIFCIIFLLGNFKVELNNKLNDLIVDFGSSLRLKILYGHSDCPNHQIVLPVLHLGNVWISGPMHFGEELKDHIVRRFDNGNLAAIKCDADALNLNLDMGSFQRGEIWSSPDFFR